jgi:hypothetical protein
MVWLTMVGTMMVVAICVGTWRWFTEIDEAIKTHVSCGAGALPQREFVDRYWYLPYMATAIQMESLWIRTTRYASEYLTREPKATNAFIKAWAAKNEASLWLFKTWTRTDAYYNIVEELDRASTGSSVLGIPPSVFDAFKKHYLEFKTRSERSWWWLLD